FRAGNREPPSPKRFISIASALRGWLPLCMENVPARGKVSEPEGIAGYVSPYPYLDVLQEKMDERIARRVPAAGRFCGFCYARLRQDETICPVCGTSTAERETVNEIPQEALRAYHAKSKTE